eukprot:CAMPEP_0168256064 /NCGR_PEP_ID=MMETSP0141_2-20121125/5634_1 /TAXON_ID=44445 /ORGANISM="Pseudo-nitzschia australis, Strain 10249 10 AB" /LENGTH=98 /DNA_ID=CAMNT_0008192697 /DNA_START=246 /DNA_END=542 /DNA_ORIENTATION=+
MPDVSQQASRCKENVVDGVVKQKRVKRPVTQYTPTMTHSNIIYDARCLAAGLSADATNMLKQCRRSCQENFDGVVKKAFTADASTKRRITMTPTNYTG